MVYRHTINATGYVFADLRDLLAKATPPRSGDRLAGIAAETAEQMIAARIGSPTSHSNSSCMKPSFPMKTMKSPG